MPTLTTDLIPQRLSSRLKNVAAFTIGLLDADTANNPPLANFRAKVERLDNASKPDAVLFAGRANKDGEIRFHLNLPKETPGQPIPALPKIKLTVLDVDGDPLHSETIQLQRGDPIPPVRVKTAPHQEKLVAPLDKWRAALGRTFSPAVQTLLQQRKIASLADLRAAKDLDDSPGLSDEDKQEIALMKTHAQLQLISRDHKLKRSLIDAGFRDVFAIAKLSRAAFLKAVEGKVPEKTADQIYELAGRKVDVLKNLALEKRVAEANGYGQPKMQMASTAAGTGEQSEPQPCTCDCQSAVSPLAYLADLLDFVLREVTYDNGALTLDRLEELFHQAYASLPADCSASEEIVRQVRICIEVLRHKALADGKASDADAAANQHAARAYDALLAALGTSSRELRLLRGAPDKDRERKAQSLGIAVSRLNELLLPNDLPPSGTPLSEQSLEMIFGLQDTSRDPLSFGVKLDDANNHVLRWQLKGVEWRRNTDESGRIYGRLGTQGNKFTLTLFKDSARTQAVAKAEGNKRTDNKPSDLALAAENDSGLYGRALISHRAVGKDCELAVVPQLLIWQLLELIQLWQKEDHPEPIYDPQLPIIDPDLLTEDHFCRPFKVTDASGRDVWINAAHQLWIQRTQQLQTKFDEIDKGGGAERTIPQMIAFVWPSNPPDWDNIATDLQGKDEDKVKTRLSELKALHLTAETFAFLNELRKRALAAASTPAPAITDPEILEREKKEREQAIDILVNVVKRRDYYAAWRQEEPTIGVSLSPTFFCIPTTESEPTHPLRVSREQRGQWFSELERNSQAPIVDPDVLHPIPNIGPYDGPAETRRRARRDQVDDIQSVLDGLAPIQRTKAWLDERLGTDDLKDAAGNVVLHALGLESIDGLQTAFDDQRLDIQPQQHGLTRRELNALLTIRKLVIANPSLADAQDWNHVFHILIQAEKRRYLYPVWRTQEATEKLTLSPEFFRDPDQPLLQLLTEDTRPIESIEWRSNPAALRAWRSQLKARYQQQASVTESLRGVVDRAEEATLPTLRDALIDVVYDDPTGTSREPNKTHATNTLLINAFESGCRKTTRVAQAIESMQLLVWGILNRQIEDKKFHIPDENQADFAANWHWLQSYAAWRAAMFVFLYPDNVLLPSLYRSDSTLFNVAVKIISGQLAPASSSGEGSTDDAPRTDVEERERVVAQSIFSSLAGLKPSSLEGIRRIIFLMLLGRNGEGSAHRAVDDSNPYYDLSRDGLLYLWDGYYLVGPDRLLVCPGTFYPESGINIYDWQNTDYELEDTYLLPIHGALTLQQAGQFDASLELFRWVYDFQQADFRFSRVKELLAARRGSINHSDNWLTDPLDPHRIAATRSDADLRFIQISIIRCLLDYAEAEFTIDTPESLARARELYLSAQRMLESDELKQTLPDCEGSIGALILEIGETYRDKPNVRDGIIDGIIDLGPQIDPDRIADLLKDLNNIITGPGPGPRPLPDIRNDTKALFEKHTPRPRPVALEGRINGMGVKQDHMLRELLRDPQVFDGVQQAGVGLAKTKAPLWSAHAMASSGGSIAIVSYGWRDLVRADEKIKIPGVSFEFCIPPNPILIGLRLRTETGLFKLSHCMNLASLRREVPVYAAPTDTRSGMPVVGVSGALSLPVANRLQGTQYRYKVLVERAKQLLGIAQQLEATYLSFLDKLDQENYTILRARHDLGLANANVTLQGLRVTEAEHGQTLALEQFNRANSAFGHYEDLIDGDLLEAEKNALMLLGINVLLQGAVALLTTGGAIVAGLTAGGVIGAESGPGAFFTALGGGGGAAAAAMTLSQTAYSSATGTLASASSYLSMVASFDRRKEEWEFQKALSDIDVQIATLQQTLADDRYNIVEQEETIAKIGANNAEDVVNFLSNKFTNTDLYNWMSGIVGGVYRYFLEQSTAMAKVAQMQLAFERQEAGLDFILSDYWAVTSGSGFLETGRDEPRDRRGMTGSARLLHDLYRMDQHAFTTDRRKLQMSKTLSLALHDPIAFQQFRETGILPFTTTLELFDRDFPGHYLRLIKRVRTSVIALIPPTHGIKATLSSTGVSRVVVSSESGGLFEERAIPREPEFVALTAPSNDSGVFELQEQPDMLLPFEGLGVANNWEFRLPKAANAFEFGTIADVLITIEYTALDSATYRQQVIQQMDRSVSADRPFSFRHQFADAWYDLHNPELIQDEARQMVVSFTTRREDFPPNVSELKIAQLSLLIAYKSKSTERIRDLSLHFTGKGQTGSAIGDASPNDDGIVSTRLGNAGSWRAMLTKEPIGEWTLSLQSNNEQNNAETRKLFKDDQIEDILFVITFGGTTPEWPS